MNTGLSEADMEYIKEQIGKFPEIEKAILFGSRAIGNWKNGSDIDLAVCGTGVCFHTIATLHSLLEDEGPMPYLIDVVDRTHLNHEKLAEHIDRKGICIYEKPAIL